MHIYIYIYIINKVITVLVFERETKAVVGAE